MKYVYAFGKQTEGNKDMKGVLGGKGANLAEMAKLGVPVPPGFTISTDACEVYYKNGGALPQEIEQEIDAYVKKLEEETGRTFGDPKNPLLVSVRSGAAVSMPGMMDTVLNIGINDTAAMGLAQKTGNARFAQDSYRRFLQMFGEVVLEVPHSEFETALERAKRAKGIDLDTDLDVEDLQKLVDEYKRIIRKTIGKDCPMEARAQLRAAINAVFRSWNNDRAIAYRRLNDIRGLNGTAVNVQEMVFGNMGETSGTGVCFSRDPSTGENVFYGEYLMNAQGEDVVAGIRTPNKISDLAEQQPAIYKELLAIKDLLEQHYKDMQDMEFTIQEGKLFLLQTRNGKRTARAAVRIAVEMVQEGLLAEDEALLRVAPAQLDQLLHKQLDPVAVKQAVEIAKGLPASPGAAVGAIVFTAAEAHDRAQRGEKVLLVRTETSPEDIEGMNAAQGILTARGGMTSHAAVVARGMGKCCVAGCSDLTIDEKAKRMIVKGGKTYVEGDYLTLDGSKGVVYEGKLAVVDPELSGDFATLMSWADARRKLKVRANADTPKDAQQARAFGAEGIGLCRTEHMFFEADRIKAVREMILAESKEGRERALAKLEPMQEADFKGLFTAMAGLPVTIRLLDPPLHEFLPQEEKDIEDLAQELGVTVTRLKAKIAELHEFNPMLGHRGCRLAITYPEIAEMQVRAIIKAALAVKAEGHDVVPEIMIPLVGFKKEFDLLAERVRRVADGVIAQIGGTGLTYKVGTMIEVPRGALTAGEIAEEAEFFSFGTNDLTQMTLGFSRDDAGKFLKAYEAAGIFEKDPFQTLDQAGVGQLVTMAATAGRKSHPGLKLGICGEHGGDPASVAFCHAAGLDYVSCSPFRVPIARLAAAHAALKR